MSAKPNILFILSDQLRRQALSSYGGPVPTPNFDALAAAGISFSQCYSNNPMCTPARAALLTGRHPHALQDEKGEPYWHNDRLLDTNEVGFAKSLSSAGYSCGYIGKCHNDRVGFGAHIPAGPRRHGFDGYWAAYHAAHPHAKPFYYTTDGSCVERDNCWEPDMQVALALESLRDNSEQDKMLFLAFGPPHTPFTLPSGKQYLLEMARQAKIPHSPNIPIELHELAHEEAINYHANVLGLDEAMGNLLTGINDAGLAENTLIIFTADHGSQLFNHGLREKNQFFEEACAVPLMLRWPGHIPSGKSSTIFAHLSDIAPTILDLCDIPIPERMQGKSLADISRGTSDTPPHQFAYLEANLPRWDYKYGQGPQGNRRCIITEDWKLVLRETNDGRGLVIPAQLFERKNDPHELVNRAEDPACQWTICQLVQQALPTMQKLDDPFSQLL